KLNLVSSKNFELPIFFKAKINYFEILNKENNPVTHFYSGEQILFRISVKIDVELRNPIFSLRLSDLSNVNVITWRSNDYVIEPLPKNNKKNFVIEIRTLD